MSIASQFNIAVCMDLKYKHNKIRILQLFDTVNRYSAAILVRTKNIKDEIIYIYKTDT